MAKDNQDNRTEDEKREAEMTFEDSDIQKGIDLIETQGYLTKKDFPKMTDDVWAIAFEKQLDLHFRDDDSDDPYLYVEKFDFVGGKIDSIIFDMDKVPNRDAAMKTLAKATGQKQA
ncbi:hypothetical protein MOO44_03145 [Nicoliella spurrieriana]|uniref:Uncharacterized protein n=1 Tax=Nicoliella spurrieriana TaxID=2925830 RepID=A0A976RT06_9LACO|nr:hypothetical protein [Nicoliella spurrieriana]UQS87174.1 hypothetical protein MOO44_03145 [Nicoliella spurrieriana]